MKRQIWRRVTAFLLMAVIITQSGMTAFATEDIPGVDKAEEYASEQEQEAAETEETGEAEKTPEETPEDTENPEETPKAAEDQEKTPEETTEDTKDQEKTPEETTEDIEEPEETPEEILPEDSLDSELPEGEEMLPETPEVAEDPGEESEEPEIKWLESRLREEAPVENLTEEQIFELDERLAEFAEGISPEIVIEENGIAFTGELEYAEGYYLAFRMNTDRERFTQSGTIQMEYEYEEEDVETVRYEAPEDVWEKGFWDVIIPLPENAPKLIITVDNDGEDELPAKTEEEGKAEDSEEEEAEAVYERYAPGTYEIDLSGLQKKAAEADVLEADTFEANALEGAMALEQSVITSMTAPVIKSVTTRDTSAVVKFVPNDIIRSIEAPDEGNGYYTVKLTEKVTGEVLDAVDITWQVQEAKYSYKFSTTPEGTEKAPLYTCEIRGLSSNKAYTVVIIANYGAGESKLVKESKAMSFTTKREMLTGAGGSLDVFYITLDDLRDRPNDKGTQVDYEDGEINLFECNRTYALMAEVSNLSRALETEKLTWTVLTAQEKAANKKDVTLKAGASTFEAQLVINKPGIYIITAASTVTKEKLFRFFVEVPEENGENTARISLQSELFYFYERDEKINRNPEKEIS